jgi:hypothetical protein
MVSLGLRILAVVGLLVAGMVYPFLPGEHDRVAVPVSLMIQAAAAPAGLLVPLGLVWLVVNRRRRLGDPAASQRWHAAFAWTALMVTTLAVVLAAALVATGERARLIGLVTLVAWGLVVRRWVGAIRGRGTGGASAGLPATRWVAPAYCLIVPAAVLLAQLPLAKPLTNASRARAMAASAEVLDGLERYRAANGGYPEALEALHPDYSARVVGVDGYRYARRGESYDLSFEQPRFLLDDIGAREIVVYNPRDEQLVLSHAAWVLAFSPAQLAANQGWYSARELGVPHWRSFLFD